MVMAALYGLYKLYLPKKAAQEFSYNQQTMTKNALLVPIAILGGGPAGYAAGLYGARAHVHTVIFEGPYPGGQLMKTSHVENWPGIQKQLGSDIMKGCKTQAESFGAQIAPYTVKKIHTDSWPYKLTLLDGSEVFALSVIIATGASPRKLTIPGEDKYWGSGVTTCAICDAPFYKDKSVIVVGGGDSALEEAMQLAPYAKDIMICVRGESFRGAAAMIERLKQYPQIHTSFKTKVLEIKGTGTLVNAVTLEINGEKVERAIDGVFLAIGHIPNTSCMPEGMRVDSLGHIIISSESRETSVPGIFAAGDVSDHRYRQAGVAAGDGIKAALDAIAFVGSTGFIEKDNKKILYSPNKEGMYTALEHILTTAEYEQKIAQDNKLVLLDFYTTACPSCMRMMPIVERVVFEHKDAVVGYKVDAFVGAELMKKFVVPGVPTIVVIRNGNEIARTKDTMTYQDFNAFITEFIK
jgi:thioredoxin reductase (NADPH)